MIKLPIPSFGVEEVVNLSATSVRDLNLRSRVDGSLARLVELEVDYRARCDAQHFYTMPKSSDPTGLLTSAELLKLYKSPFSRAGSRARSKYDELKLSPEHGICPL